MVQQKIRQLTDDLEPLFATAEEGVHRAVSCAERDAIRVSFAAGYYDQLELKLINYIAKYVAVGYLHQLFYVYYEVKLARWRGEEASHICSLAQRALELTKGAGEIPDCKAKNYTYTELELLLTLIEYGDEQWRNAEKKEIGLLKIIQYVRLYFEDERRMGIEDRAWQLLVTEKE